MSSSPPTTAPWVTGCSGRCAASGWPRLSCSSPRSSPRVPPRRRHNLQHSEPDVSCRWRGWGWLHRSDDDLLTGMDETGQPHGIRAFFATTITLSVVVWSITFELGAYHAVF